MGPNILLALGSLIMFGTFLGSSNRLLIGNNQIASQNEYYIAALSYCQSVVEEAKTKKFDAAVPSGALAKTNVVMTSAINLGTDNAGETPPSMDVATQWGYASAYLFDDVDDYKNYRRRVNSSRAENYDIFVDVGYVDPVAPDVIVTSPTRTKRMLVKITSPYFPQIEKNGGSVQDTLAVSYLFSY